NQCFSHKVCTHLQHSFASCSQAPARADTALGANSFIPQHRKSINFAAKQSIYNAAKQPVYNAAKQSSFFVAQVQLLFQNGSLRRYLQHQTAPARASSSGSAEQPCHALRSHFFSTL